MAAPTILTPENISSLISESFDDVHRGHGISWKTLMSASKTATDTFTAGIATCEAGETYLCSHRHKHAELYHIVSGCGVVEIDDIEHTLSAGSVVFIPSNAKHGVKNTSSSCALVWLYIFAADDFSEIKYRFPRETKSGAGEDP